MLHDLLSVGVLLIGRSVLVVGGGDSAVEAAISLARESTNEVVLSYRKEQLFRIKQKNQNKNGAGTENRTRIVASTGLQDNRYPTPAQNR